MTPRYIPLETIDLLDGEIRTGSTAWAIRDTGEVVSIRVDELRQDREIPFSPDDEARCGNDWYRAADLFSNELIAVKEQLKRLKERNRQHKQAEHRNGVAMLNLVDRRNELEQTLCGTS